ncbi:cytochrome P450 20A1-like [Amphiura filiformis]|uniref:cytochrome P450 20A1-like n=1 Tax=Amphiura filiformis TaxID=82378 RepID=UPI003B2171FE
MLTFVVAVTFVMGLIGAVIYFRYYSFDPLFSGGNIPDIGKAGNMHAFLVNLHASYGPIASFWWGPKLAVSIASPELFRQQQNVFDRPSELFVAFQPLLGENSIMYANGANGKKRRNLYAKAFSHRAVGYYMETFSEVASELVSSLQALPNDEHISIQQFCLALVLKGITRSSYGNYFKNHEACLAFRRNFDICWGELEYSLGHGAPEEGSARDKAFKEARGQLLSTFDAIIKKRRVDPPPPERQLFIDILLENDLPESQIMDDCITYAIGGFHPSGFFLVWALYYIVTHQDVQEKLHQEIQSVLGEDKDVDSSHIAQLVYLRQVLDETLRITALAPWAGRFHDTDITLAGYVIPKHTPVIQALGVVSQDENQWTNPEKFNPDRFSPENSKHRDKFAFQPFGFAGKRTCPGYRFAYAEVSVALALLCQTFKFNIVKEQVVEPVYGLVAFPKEDIWVTLEKR